MGQMGAVLKAETAQTYGHRKGPRLRIADSAIRQPFGKGKHLKFGQSLPLSQFCQDAARIGHDLPYSIADFTKAPGRMSAMLKIA